MADYPILTSPDGSTSINVGSVMLADGVDYGMAPMFANGIGGNPFADGGQLGYRYSGPRMFKFPIRLATVGALTPAGVARALRQIAQPGAVVDLMLAGVATANAVRFDVIDGRVRESQDVKMWAGAQRREGVLELDVQPYGYSPTWITLASVPSCALPGSIAIPGGSIIGDVPGLAQIMVMSSLPSQQFGAIGTYGYDAFYYSLGHKVSAFLPAANLTPLNQLVGAAASLVGDSAAPGSQLWRTFIVPSLSAYYGPQAGWNPLIAVDLNPSYFGRYRAHVFARFNNPSYGGAMPIAVDIAMSGAGRPSSFATGGIIASVGQPLTLASDGAYSPVPTGFGFYPVGDITVPTAPGGMNQTAWHRLQLWANVPTLTLPTYVFDVAGIWLQSLDAANGVVARDLQNPRAADSGGLSTWIGMYPFSIDAYQRDVQVSEGVGAVATGLIPALFMGSQIPAFSLLDRYRGVMPQVSPSMTSMEIMLAARRLQVSYRNEILADTPKAWWRFNEASGLATVLDWSGQGLHGAASNLLLGASSLLYGEPGGATGATGFAQSASSGALPNGNAPRTLEAWYQPATYTANQGVAGLGASTGAGFMFMIEFNPTSIRLQAQNNDASYAYAWKPGQTYHVAAAYDATNVALYVNGQGLGTVTFTAALTTAGVLTAGNLPIGGLAPAKGGIDEVAVYPSSLSAARILAHYLAGRNTQGATSPPVYHQGGYAGVSLRYQPRFSFQREI